jgi:hypothetical protein
MLRAKRIARTTSTIFNRGRDVINDPIFLFETVCKWSQLTAQFWGMPSAFERNTSEGILRTVDVMGAIVTSPRYSNTESRVRIRTGRFLSGGINLYQRISPCFIHHPTPAQFPKPKNHRRQLGTARTPGDAYVQVARCCTVQGPHEVLFLRKQSDLFGAPL